MKKLFLVTIISISILGIVPNVKATSYGFMRDALREYKANPTEENKKKVETARLKIKMIGIGTYAIPIVLVGLYILLRLKFKKREKIT